MDKGETDASFSRGFSRPRRFSTSRRMILSTMVKLRLTLVCALVRSGRGAEGVVDGGVVGKAAGRV